MTGLTQQEQEQNSPFTLEAVLEEESDINTNHINDALPFDKCLKADTQADEEEKKRRLYNQLGTMKAARKLKLKRIKLYFDFSGIEDIALGKIQPKQKNRFLLSYREFFTEINKYIKIDFCKVKSHSGIELNNKADRLAKQAVGLRKEM